MVGKDIKIKTKKVTLPFKDHTTYSVAEVSVGALIKVTKTPVTVGY